MEMRLGVEDAVSRYGGLSIIKNGECVEHVCTHLLRASYGDRGIRRQHLHRAG